MIDSWALSTKITKSANKDFTSSLPIYMPFTSSLLHRKETPVQCRNYSSWPWFLTLEQTCLPKNHVSYVFQLFSFTLHQVNKALPILTWILSQIKRGGGRKMLTLYCPDWFSNVEIRASAVPEQVGPLQRQHPIWVLVSLPAALLNPGCSTSDPVPS